MKLKNINLLVLVAVFSLGIAASPAVAHTGLRYDPDRKLPPRPIAHSHENQQQEANPTEASGFNPVQGAAWLAGGIYKTVEGTIKAILSPFGSDEAAEENQSRRPSAGSNRTGQLWGFPGRK